MDQGVVITGHDRSAIGLLVFANEAGHALPKSELASFVQKVRREFKQSGAGSSQAPTRAIVLPDAPSAAAGEITDKGYVNQRLVLTRRSALVDALYASAPSAEVIGV
jgi:feruloyl-CoA synthase